MKYELRTIAIWPLIKVTFFLNLVVGFIVGLLYALLMGFILSIASSFPMPQGEYGALEGMSFGWLIVIMPIMGAIGMAIFYTLFVVIGAAIYNLIARAVGGMEFEFNPVEPEPAKAPVTAYTSAGYPGQQSPPPSPSRFAPPPPPPPPERSQPPTSPEPSAPPPPEQSAPPPPPPEAPKRGEGEDDQKPES
jgi:outer membrane biosynthesis protein TonB